MVPSHEPEFKPVVPGSVRLSGDFAGIVTTSTHCLEVSLPLDFEVPVAALEPALAAFTGEIAAGRCSPNILQDQDMTSVWNDVGILLKQAKANGVQKCNGDVACAHLPGSVTNENYLRLQSKEEALEVDYEAKEALVQQLVKERDALKVELSRLKDIGAPKNIEEGATMSPRQKRLQGLREESRRIDEEEEKTISEDRPDVRLYSDQDRFPDDPKPELEDGSIWVDGSFYGSALSKKHFLDITLPVKGFIPGNRVLDALYGITSIAAKPGEHGSGGAGECWEQLAKLFTADIPAEKLVEKSMPMLQHQLSEALQEIQHLREERHKSSGETQDLREQHRKAIFEAEGLRNKNQSLVNLVASAESNALQLRSTLRRRVPAVPNQSPSRRLFSTSPTSRSQTSRSPASRNASPKREVSPKAIMKETLSDQALVADLRELERWAQELRTLSGS